MSEHSLKGKLALITGASRGIGRAVAELYAKEGAHVIAVARARSQGALEELDDTIQAIGGSCTIAPLDLQDGDALDRLGALIYERWGKLDILVGNAGILGAITPITHMDVKEWGDILNINLTANWRLLRSMDPLLKQSDAGRAIFVSSGAAHKHKPYWGGYAVSKAALEELVLTYAAETKASKIKANLIDPGPIRTMMRAKAVPGEDPSSLPTTAEIAPLFLELASDTLEKTGELIKYYEWANIQR
ncbi:SDR family NAD(P)-dependent oxidoreductase [Temperatibacter marinus]|uniref:SDR family NAD(P)-dependent oxidoreductase n=1 Tax=Temperatibacter marinus TaxID=1456591 RepID=A0AA52EED7_9PROT|nr:SDR family NAD(P)-dependent oxidoreductase [Temperatibacter marinus]WND02128.1 SDR family NAD(P)-dependent oxidoreductase [Temperatibacter marinus]